MKGLTLIVYQIFKLIMRYDDGLNADMNKYKNVRFMTLRMLRLKSIILLPGSYSCYVKPIYFFFNGKGQIGS